MFPRLFSLVRLLPLLALLAACYEVAPDTNQSATSAQRSPDPRPLNTIVVDGSAIVGVLVRNVALGYQTATPGDTVRLGNSGTRDGFKLLCDDKTDIQDAVSAITTDERAECLRNQIDYLQIVVGYDALAIVGDAPVQGCISASEVAFLYTHNTANLHWNDVRSGLPPDPVRVFAPPAVSAAAQFFAEQVLSSPQQSSPSSIPSPLDIQGLIAEGNGIGYMALVDAQKLAGRLTIIALDSGAGCTAPSEQTVWNGSYSLLSRPLYLYINRQSLHRGEVSRFVNYVLSLPGQGRATDAGFLPAQPDAYHDAQAEVDRLSAPGN